MQTSKASVPAKSRALVVLVLVFAMVASATAGTWWTVATDGTAITSTETLPEAPQVIVDWHNNTGLKVTVDVAGLNLAVEDTAGSEFLVVTCPRTPLAGEMGAPALPVVRRLFLVPEGAAVELSFNQGPASVIDLAGTGFANPIIPMQPPINMAPGDLARATFHYNQAAYAADELLPAKRVTITELGIVRGQRLHMLEVHPVAYNPAGGMLMVWPHIDVDISFHGGAGFGGLGSIAALSGVLLNPQPTRPLGRGLGNLLILVSDSVFTSEISTYANAKTAQGYEVMTHWVDPGTPNTQIKAYIQSLWGTPDAPDYVLLVGDTDTMPYWVGLGEKHAATDLPYACMDPGDDWYPDLTIGRFCVRTEEELQAVADKNVFVEAGVYPDPEYVQRAAFLATDDMVSGGEETHDWVVENYMDPNDFTSYKIYARLGGNTQDIYDALNTGCLYCVYFGHSSANGWWAPAFGQPHVRNLANLGRYGLAFGFSCNTARFTNDECLGETWIRVADKGAAAYLSASTYVYYMEPPWHESTFMEKHFFESFFVEDIREVGPAWQAALYDLLAFYGPGDPVCRDYFEMFVLLGDPSLRMPRSRGFGLSPDPALQSVCAPPNNQAVYTIEVEQYVGFDEPVTLTASGQPTGSSVYFSVNSVPPPFTTEMTVSNIVPGSPGDYTVEITGSATTMQRSTSVRLHLSTVEPGAVTLLSPPNGAVDLVLNPTLTWQAVSQAAEYELEIATDASFANVVYSETVTEPAHTVAINLETATQHHWHVQAVNGCGSSGFSPTFTFTTLDQPDYFSEEFIIGKGFDLDNYTAYIAPDGSDDYYEICVEEATGLPTNPTGGTPLALGDNNFEYVFPTAPVSLYGTAYDFFYVNSNGNLTFTDGDSTSEESLTAHFAMPRVSGVFDDLNPAAGGNVSWKELPDRVAVTFENVPEYGTANSSTFQFELFFDGEIDITWLNVDSEDSMVGLSEGFGIPADYLESDLSESGPCTTPGDLNCDGAVNVFDIDPFVLALSDPAGYAAAYPECDILNGDCNGDGLVDAFDIDPFVVLLLGG